MCDYAAEAEKQGKGKETSELKESSEVVYESTDEESLLGVGSGRLIKRKRLRPLVDSDDEKEKTTVAKAALKQRADESESTDDELSEEENHNAERQTSPTPILPTDDEHTRYDKMKRAIEYYWHIQDSRDVVPQDMRPRNKNGVRKRLELEDYGQGTTGVILARLYRLALITQGRRKEAWAKIREGFDGRAGRTEKKMLRMSDIDYAFGYFEGGSGEEENGGMSKLETASASASDLLVSTMQDAGETDVGGRDETTTAAEVNSDDAKE